MKIGTKSVLFGTHQFLLHPLFVFLAFVIRYRRLPRIAQLFAIIFHDIGLFGCPNIDGTEGEMHPERSCSVIDRLPFLPTKFKSHVKSEILGHSRFYAMRSGTGFSELFQADKLSIGLYPSWLYIFLGMLSGEISEYRKLKATGKYSKSGQYGEEVPVLIWFLDLKSRLVIMGLDPDVEKYLQNRNFWN